MLFSPTTLYSIIQNSPVETILSFVRDEILGDEDFRVDRSRGASGSCFGLTLRSMGVSSDWTADWDKLDAAEAATAAAAADDVGNVGNGKTG